MAYRSDATGRMGRPRALAGVAFALLFIVSGAMAGQHSHADTAESPAACAVCASTTQLPDLRLDYRSTPLDGGSRLAGRPAAASSDRARAPPAALPL